MPFREVSPKFEIILGVFDMLGIPGNKKRQLTQPPNQPRKVANITTPMTTKHKHMFLSEKKMEEIERKNARVGTLPGENPVECQAHQWWSQIPHCSWRWLDLRKLKNEEVREPNGYFPQPYEFDSRNHFCNQGFQRCRQYIYQAARCCHQCFHQNLFRNNCLALDPSLDNSFQAKGFPTHFFLHGISWYDPCQKYMVLA